MALLSEKMKEKFFDVRMIQRGMSKGTHTQAEVDKFLKNLPDDAENVDVYNLEDAYNEVCGKSGLRKFN